MPVGAGELVGVEFVFDQAAHAAGADDGDAVFGHGFAPLLVRVGGLFEGHTLKESAGRFRAKFYI